MTFSGTNSPRAEAILYLEWVRGAVGRFDAGADPAGPVEAEAPPASGAAQKSGSLEPRLPPSAPCSPTPIEEPNALPSTATRGEGEASFEALRREALACRRCRLCETRTKVVFGEGSRHPRLMVVGEAPGADEDASGRPFVGKAGQLLTKMLAAIGLSRDEVFIANVIKCRPPGNRPPEPDEVASCIPYLREQIRLLDPELVLVLGNHAAHAVLSTDRGISSIRGTIVTGQDGRRVLPTFHPSYLLRNPAAKREAWLDLQLVAKTLGIAVPAGRANRES